METMLGDVEKFIKARGMTPSAFGRQSVGDPKLVFELRQGRELRSKTAQRVRDFMLTAKA